MNFQDAEKTYRDLRAQHAAGKLSDADFEAEVAKLRLQDSQGRWWQIGVQTGEWYMHDGQKWNKARPPAAPPLAAPPITPGGIPEAAVPKAKPGSALPARLFSAAPAGRSNGGGRLPPALLIVIVAVVALVGLGVLVGLYVFISGQASNSTSRTTSTPTISIAALPTPEIATITLEPPTGTPEPPPTLVISATAALTITHTPAVERPTATRKPAATATSAGPTATPTVNAPPGVYVTGLKVDPAKPNIGDTLQFTVEFLNTSGSEQTYVWLVKVFQCPEQCDTYKTSFGETTRKSENVPTGSAALTSDRHVNIGVGRCDYTAIPYYIDQSNQQVVPFLTTESKPLYQNFAVCH